MEKEYLKRIAQMITRDARRSSQGPRSKIVEAIAVLLYAKPMRASEIASILGFSSRYVSSYLSYWKSRGLFSYENGYWTLTEEGRRYAEEVLKRYEEQHEAKYVTIAKAILAASANTARNDKREYHHPGQYPESLPFLATGGGTVPIEQETEKRRVCAHKLLESYSTLLPQDEHDVLRSILEHYTRWGKTYLYLDQIRESLDADHAWLASVLRSLQSKGLVYIYHDKRMGVRVGLSRQLKKLLDSCLSSLAKPPGS